MKRVMALLIAAMMTLSCALVFAEETQRAPDYIMEGYDGDSSGHVWDTNLFFARMQERTGISFQFRQFSTYEDWIERKAEILRGENLPDVLFKASLTAGETRDMAAAGVIIDLKPYLEEYAPDLWALLQADEERLASITLPDGTIPALPAINELQNNDLPWINREWLRNLRLEMPTTAEELTEVLRAFKTGDPNRNGKADEIPLSFIGMWELRFLGHAFGIIDNDYYMTCRDGQVTSSLTTDENRAFLTWLHQLWEENLLDHQGFTTVDTLRQITDTNTTVPYGMLLTTTPLTVVPAESATKYQIMPPLKYEGKQIYRDLLGEVIRGTFAITRECSEPEKLVAWVNYLYTDDGARLAQAGLEGEDYLMNEDGTWEWMNDATTVANVTLPEVTIVEGGSAPGISPIAFQLTYSDEETRSYITQMASMKEYDEVPYPLVFMTKEDEARAAELQAVIAPYAEQRMAAFVTGDAELTDANWNDFVNRLEELGLGEAVSLWQKYAR